MLGTNSNQAGLNLEDLRVIVVTGPDTLGRQQVVTGLRESEQQLLDIEEVAVTNQQEGVGGVVQIIAPYLFPGNLKETGPPTLQYFQTQLFHQISLMSKEKVRVSK